MINLTFGDQEILLVLISPLRWGRLEKILSDSLCIWVIWKLLNTFR